MLLIFIILIIEARALSGLFSTYPAMVLTAPETNTIEAVIIGARTDFDTQSPTPGAALQDLTLTNSLTVLGDTLFGKTSIAGGLTIDGSLSLGVQGLQSLGSTLYLEQNKLAPIDLMGGALRVNTDGSIAINGNMDVRGVLGAAIIAPVAGDVTVDLTRLGSGSAGFGSLLVKGTSGAFAALDSSGSAHFSGNVDASGSGRFARITSPLVETTKLLITPSGQSSSVGQGTIPTGFATMKILTNAIGPNSRVYVTPISVSTQPISVTQLTPATTTAGGSFTVETSTPVPHDLDFNWFIIN